jgi:hypothetical protein
MLCPPHAPAPVVQDWIERHRHPASFLLHMLGIPPTLIGVLLVPIYFALASVPIFLFSLALFVGGYLIQFAGHAVEGSEPGEVSAIRRRLGGWLRERRNSSETGRARRIDQSGPVQ